MEARTTPLSVSSAATAYFRRCWRCAANASGLRLAVTAVLEGAPAAVEKLARAVQLWSCREQRSERRNMVV